MVEAHNIPRGLPVFPRGLSAQTQLKALPSRPPDVFFVKAAGCSVGQRVAPWNVGKCGKKAVESNSWQKTCLKIH